MPISGSVTNPIDAIYTLEENTVKFGSNTYRDFANFLFQGKILDMAVATTIGLYISSFSTDITNTIGMPIINKIVGNDLDKKYVIHVMGIKFEIGKIIEIFVKFVIMLVIVYIIFRFIPNTIHSVS